MAKVGRPKLEKAKDRNLSLRVTEDDYVKLKAYASEHNLTISQVLKKGVNLLYQQC